MLHSRNVLSWRIALGVTLLSLLMCSVFVGAQEKRTITVMLQDFSEANTRDVIENDIVPRFESMYSDVEVSVQWTSWDAYVSKYVTWYLGGTLPDVVSIGASALGQFAEQGIIQSIDHYMRNWSALDDFIPVAVQDAQIHGEFWAVPYNIDVRTLAYNRIHFDDVGLDRDNPPKTWDELEEYAKRLTEYDENMDFIREGFDVRPSVQRLLPFLFQAGGGYISDDGKSALLAEDPAVEAVQYMKDLIYESQVSRSTSSGIVGANVASMAYEGTWFMHDRWNDEDFGVAEPLRNREQATNAHINRFGIASTSQHPDLAWEWIQFMLEPENISILLEENRNFPPRISALQTPEFSADSRWNNWLQAALVAVPVPGWVTSLATVAGETDDALQHIFQDNVPVRTRLHELVDYLDEFVLNE